MKVVILAGGLGTRLAEETQVRPKPMVEIGGRPILWHIMKIYAAYGLDEFIVCLGYKGYVIKEYFANYALHMSDMTFDLASNTVNVMQNRVEPWRVSTIDTGDRTMTGGRLRRISSLVAKDECMPSAASARAVSRAPGIARSASASLRASRPAPDAAVVRFNRHVVHGQRAISSGHVADGPAQRRDGEIRRPFHSRRAASLRTAGRAIEPRATRRPSLRYTRRRMTIRDNS